MFDVGFAELVLLFLIGLVVLGPERLPKVARTLGGLTRKARSSWLNLKRSIEAEMRAEELKQPLEKFQKDMRAAVDDVNRRVDALHRGGRSRAPDGGQNAGGTESKDDPPPGQA